MAASHNKSNQLFLEETWQNADSPPSAENEMKVSTPSMDPPGHQLSHSKTMGLAQSQTNEVDGTNIDVLLPLFYAVQYVTMISIC